MKAIRTTYYGPTNTKPSKIIATTGEKGQRLAMSLCSIVYKAGERECPHAATAHTLANRYGWKGALIGSGFPDGNMVWVFADSPDRA